MTGDEITEAIRELIRRSAIPLSRLPALLKSYGHLEGEDDRRDKCRAIAALMRRIAEDPEVAELLQRTLEAHSLRGVRDLFNPLTAPRMLTEAFWNDYNAKVREVEKRVEDLRKATFQKVALLEFLAGKLAELKCADEFELPVPAKDLFPPVRVP